MTRAVIVGGGVYAPALCAALARSVAAPRVELVLTARDPSRLSRIAGESTARVAALRPEWSVRGELSLERALDGARHVVLLIRVGGLDARAHDERFPRAQGVVGDEGLGPGGVANAWRTVPTLRAMAPSLRASGAAVWNLVAPLGVTTRALLEHGVPTVGVCELPWVTRTRFGCAPGALGYAGLNHAGWFWPRTDAGLAALRASPEVDPETLARFGAAPLRYVYELFERDAGARLGLRREPDRAGTLARLSDDALAAFAREPGAWRGAGRATPWFDLALAPMIAAVEGGDPWEGFANVRAGPGCEFADEGAVVELPATVDARGVHPRRDPGMPVPVRAWLTALARAERITWEAARDRDPAALRAAMAALPLNLTDDALDALTRAALETRYPPAAAARDGAPHEDP